MASQALEPGRAYSGYNAKVLQISCRMDSRMTRRHSLKARFT